MIDLILQFVLRARTILNFIRARPQATPLAPLLSRLTALSGSRKWLVLLVPPTIMSYCVALSRAVTRRHNVDRRTLTEF